MQAYLRDLFLEILFDGEEKVAENSGISKESLRGLYNTVTGEFEDIYSRGERNIYTIAKTMNLSPVVVVKLAERLGDYRFDFRMDAELMNSGFSSEAKSPFVHRTSLRKEFYLESIKEGKDIDEIAALEGVSFSAVYSFLSGHGILGEYRKRFPPKQRGNKRRNYKNIKKLVEDRRSGPYMASYYRVSRERIRQVLIKRGLHSEWKRRRAESK